MSKDFLCRYLLDVGHEPVRDAVLVYFQLPPRMLQSLGAAPRRGAARGRPFPKFAHAPEPFQRCRRVLRPDIEALRRILT